MEVFFMSHHFEEPPAQAHFTGPTNLERESVDK
jgi:hypothetical protein